MPSARNPFGVLARHRNFRLFWVGQTLSLVGSWMQTMAVGWLALQLSNSAFVVGLVASIGALPIVLFGMHAGAFVDRGDRLRIVRFTQAVFLVQATVLWAITASGHVTIPLLLTLQFIQGLASAIEIPARQSLIIQLVGREDLQPAIALNSSGFNLARVVGPALGGVIIAQLGIAWCFGVNAVSFVAVLGGLRGIRLGERRNGGSLDGGSGNGGSLDGGSLDGESVNSASLNGASLNGASLNGASLNSASSPSASSHSASLNSASLREVLARTTRDARDGVRYLLQPGSVRDLLLLVTVGAVFGGPYLTLLPVVARDQLGLGAGGYGAMLATVGIGGLVAALLVAGPISHRARKGRVLMGAAIGFPLLLLAFAYTTHVLLAFVLLFLSGLAMITWNALSNGVLQLMVDERYRGRLMAFYALVFVGLSQALGSFAIGALARAVDAPFALASSALVLLGASLFTLRRSGFWRQV